MPSAWKKLFDGYLKQRSAQDTEEPFVRLRHRCRLPALCRRQTALRWRGVFSPTRAELNCRWVRPDDARTREPCTCARQAERIEYFTEELWRSMASRLMNRRSLSCARCARKRSRPRSSLRATTARQFCRPPASRIFSIRGLMEGDRPPRAQRQAGARCISWKRRGVWLWSRPASSSWRTRSPASLRDVPAVSGCVIGVDRGGHSKALREAGANVVVNELGAGDGIECRTRLCLDASV